jgi:CubicO group peptidase (beta-lactamase class C family)
MKTTRLVVALSLLASAAAAADAPDSLPRSTPEEQGISSSAILGFVEAAEAEIDALHSLIVVRHGHVVAEGWWEPYGPEIPHVLFSLTKSFTSTAVGLAVSEGRLSIDDTVLSIFPEEAPPEPSDDLKQMRVRDLLTMNTGHHAETIEGFPYFEPPGGSLARTFLALPVAHRPGTHFVYNTPASQMLAEIVEKVTGEALDDYLRPRLFEPLGIEDPIWLTAGDGVHLGGFGLSVRTRDIARFAQLYLQRGEWQGRQILPPEWVDQATARQVSNGSDPASDWNQGYGFQFWRSKHGNYRGDGAFGQYAIVMPEHDAVVAITSGVRDMQAVMNLVWDRLLAEMHPEPLPPASADREQLTSKLASLSLPAPSGSATSSLAAEISGRTWTFPENEQKLEALSLEAGDGETVLVLRMAGEERRIPAGHGEWRRGGTLPLPGFGSDDEPVAASGAWTAENHFRVEACLYRTPFCATYDLVFDGDQLTFDQEANVAFGPTKRPQLVGQVSDGG